LDVVVEEIYPPIPQVVTQRQSRPKTMLNRLSCPFRNASIDIVRLEKKMRIEDTAKRFRRDMKSDIIVFDFF